MRPRKAELEPIQSAMRDVQVSIESYYRECTGFIRDPVDLTTPVRSTVAFIQKMHEVLQKDFGQQARYKAVFADRLARSDAGAELIEGFRYIRNVGQHLLHPVEPDPHRVVGNSMGLGFRTSASWAEVPASAHRLLRPSTQKLKPFYEQHLLGRDVVETFLDAARFFSVVCPPCVHRTPTGEWTGFPLRHQAGLPARLHPEEPVRDGTGLSSRQWRRWMDSRPPGGDRRIICGQTTCAKGRIVFGLTFRGPASFSGFAETPEQIDRDIVLGYPYHQVDPAPHLRHTGPITDRGGQFPGGFISTVEMASWLGPVVTAPPKADFTLWGDLAGFWQPVIDKSLTDPLSWRQDRLAAWFPII